MTSGIPRTIALAALLLVAIDGTDALADPRIASFLANLAPPPTGPVPFVEKRMSSVLDLPLEVRGVMRISPDGTIDKRVVSPTEERVLISADLLTLERGGRSRTIDLARAQPWRAFHAGLTGLLQRDAETLERTFELRLEESDAGWKLEMRPKAAGERKKLMLITATGTGPRLDRLRLQQSDTEWQEMTFGAPEQ